MVRIGNHNYKDKTEAMKKAEGIGCYTVESEKRGIAYIFKEDDMAVVTGEGYMWMDKQSAENIAVEILSILEDLQDLKRMGVQI